MQPRGQSLPRKFVQVNNKPSQPQAQPKKSLVSAGQMIMGIANPKPMPAKVNQPVKAL